MVSASLHVLQCVCVCVCVCVCGFALTRSSHTRVCVVGGNEECVNALLYMSIYKFVLAHHVLTH